MNRRNLLAGIVALPLLPKQLLDNVRKSKKHVFATSFLTEESDTKHEYGFGCFIADDDSLASGREIMIISRKVKNDQWREEDGYGWNDAESAIKARTGADFIHRIFRPCRDNCRKPRLKFPEFGYEREDLKTIYKKLPECLDEISRIFKEARLP